MPPAKSSQVSLRSQLIELLGSVAKSLGSLTTSTAVIIEQARTTGIKEGINGYRSLLQVALRVLEKVASAVQSYPFPSASSKNFFSKEFSRFFFFNRYYFILNL